MYWNGSAQNVGLKVYLMEWGEWKVFGFVSMALSNNILAKNPFYPSTTLPSSLHPSSCLKVLLWHRFSKIKQT